MRINILDIGIAKNYWGWSLRGIRAWFRYGWSLLSTWTIREPAVVKHYARIGPVAFCYRHTAHNTTVSPAP